MHPPVSTLSRMGFYLPDFYEGREGVSLEGVNSASRAMVLCGCSNFSREKVSPSRAVNFSPNSVCAAADGIAKVSLEGVRSAFTAESVSLRYNQ